MRPLGQQAVQHLSGLYNAATSRIKNDKLRRVLQSDTAKHVLNSATNRLQQMAGISNVAIKKCFENENDDIKKIFIGVYSSSSITRYINYYKIIKERRCCYPFTIFSINRANKPGTHWSSFLNIYPKTQLLLFDSKGFQGFQYFIVDNDYWTINKLLYNLDKFNKKDNNLSLASLKFSTETYHKLKEREISKLTDTAKDFFHLLAETAKVNDLSKEMTVLMLFDVIQEIFSDN